MPFERNRPMSDPTFESEWAEAFPRIAAYCRRAIDNSTLADDVIQATAVRAWRGYPQFRRQSSFLTWALGIARREVARALGRPPARHISSIEASKADPPAPSPQIAAPPADWLPPAIADAVASGELSEEEGAVLTARLGNPRTDWQQVGHQLGWSASHCAVVHCRAVVKLRVFLFLYRPDLLGGLRRIAEAFAEAQQGAPKDRLRPEEAMVFCHLVLKKEPARHFVGWRTHLRSACARVIRCLQTE
jgi:RNA polymerase sigma factor (sigma-70 family)